MQRVHPRNCGVSVILELSLAFTSLLLMLPCKLSAASSEQIITPSGQKISSIFQDLKPLVLEFVPSRDKARKERWLSEELNLEGHLGAHLTMACSITCPNDTVCSGHYEVIGDSTGCVDPLDACPLPLHNAHTDTVNGTYGEGSYDSYCGQYCCSDAQGCSNP